MLDKFIFENHLGQRFEGLPNGVYLNYSDLRDYSWSFDTINNRISRFYRDITTRKIPLVVYCKSGEEAVSIMNRLHELAEADIVAKIPGKIYVGDYYTSGYITASTKSNYLIRKKYCKIELTLTSDDPVWYCEHAYTFMTESGCEEPEPVAVKYAEGTTISINDSSDGFVKGLTLHGKTTQDGTPTPENPVELVIAGASGAIKTTVCGKNLLDFENLNIIRSHYINASGEVVFSENLHYFEIQLDPGLYTFSLYNCPSANIIRIHAFDASGAWLGQLAYRDADASAVVPFTVPDNAHRITVNIPIDAATMQIEVGGKGTGYEPYKGQTLTASTPNGLPGTPVASGGNYTDENGQQYLSSYRDYGSGVDVQMVGCVDMGKLDWFVSDGSFATKSVTDYKYGVNGLCSKYPISNIANIDKTIYMNGTWHGHNTIAVKDSAYADAATFKAAMSGVMLYYELAEPIETPLSAEELAQYSALRTYKPNTTVYNDGGAYMEIGYYPISETNSVVIARGNESFKKGGTDYPFDYPYDYALSVNGRKIVCNSVGTSAFRLLIYGEATNPAVVINGHVYTVNGTVAKGETLLIDSLNKTITLTTVSGKKVNWFDKRGREEYIFEPLPAGQSTVTWSGTFGFDLTVVEKRSEPKWT